MLTAWWAAPEWGKEKAMKFPTRPLRLAEVIVVVPEREKGDKEQPPNDRVRIYR